MDIAERPFAICRVGKGWFSLSMTNSKIYAGINKIGQTWFNIYKPYFPLAGMTKMMVQTCSNHFKSPETTPFASENGVHFTSPIWHPKRRTEPSECQGVVSVALWRRLVLEPDVPWASDKPMWQADGKSHRKWSTNGGFSTSTLAQEGIHIISSGLEEELGDINIPY